MKALTHWVVSRLREHKNFSFKAIYNLKPSSSWMSTLFLILSWNILAPTYAQPLLFPETTTNDTLLISRSYMSIINNINHFVNCNLWKKRPCQHLFSYSDSVISLAFSPLIHMGFGTMTTSRQIPYFNRKGLRISGHIKEKILFYSEFTDNQIGLPPALRYYIDTSLNSVLPHFIWTKNFDGYLNDTVLTKGVDFNDARSLLTIIAMDKPFLAFSIGFATNQIGYGYLTPFLSYRTSPYTFLRADFEYKRWKYLILWATMKHFTGVPASRPFPNKHFVAHTLEFQISKRLTLAFHEQIMMFRDTTSLLPDWNYFNPIIFFRTVEHYLGSPDNAGLGLSLMYRHKWFRTWLNLFIDDLFISHLQADIKQAITGKPQYFAGSYLNKWAISTGFAIIWNNLHIQSEHIRIRPFTYSHSSVLQNFSHYGYGLAHPRGANLWEALLKVTYKFNKWEVGSMFIAFKQGIDTGSANYGGNIFKNFHYPTRYYGNYTTQGLPLYIYNTHVWVSYKFNSSLYADLYFLLRQLSLPSYNEQNAMILLSLRWHLFNPYNTLWFDL